MSCGWNCSTNGGKTVSISTTELTVRDVMLTPDRIPVVRPHTLLKKALEEMTRFRLGIASIVEDDDFLAGIFTDGDIRRMLLKDQKPFSALFADDVIRHATRQPSTTLPEVPLTNAVRIMEDHAIWDLPVVDGDGKLAGLLHLHPAVKALLDI